MGQLVAYHGGRFLLFAGTEALRGTGPGTVGDGVACHSGFKVLKLPYERMNESNWDRMLYHSLPKFCICVFLPDDRKGLQGMVEEIASSPKFLHDHLPLKCVPVG